MPPKGYFEVRRSGGS
jgi:hypothetical protein